MKTPRRTRWSHGGFTLTELLVAVAILALIILTVSLMLSSAQKSISISHQLTDCDDQARLVLARMQNDFTKIVKRTDVDFISAKQTGNDAIFFYSQAVGDASRTKPFPNGAENPVSLVGYIVQADPNNQSYASAPADLQRLGRGLNWNSSTTLTASDNMVFLTPASSSASSSLTFDPNSTLDGHWATVTYSGTTYNTIGAAPTYAPAAPVDPDYHVIGDEVFRFEFCYLLKDGSYSDYPAESNTANVASNIVPLIVMSRPPNSSDTSASLSFGPGTRWFDTNAGRGYLCVSSQGTLVWQGLGVQDVAAIVVAIALIDRNSRTLLYNAGGTTAELAGLLHDSSDTTDSVNSFLQPSSTGTYTYTASAASGVHLMQQRWRNTINASSFATSVASATGVSAGLAKILASHITTYQRYIYLNTAASL